MQANVVNRYMLLVRSISKLKRNTHLATAPDRGVDNMLVSSVSGGGLAEPTLLVAADCRARAVNEAAQRDC